MKIITSLDQITEKWLSEQLTQEVIAFDIHPVEAHNSIAARLTVQVANGEVRKLFLKLKQNGEGQREVTLYKNAPQLKGIIPCFSAGYNAETGDSHVLLQDVSATHSSPIEPKQLISLQGLPSEKHLHLIIDSLAAWHNHGWENPNFAEKPHFFTSAEAYSQRVQKYYDDWQKFNEMGFSISDEWAAIYEDALKIIPKLWNDYLASRFAENCNLTVIHGDCYFTQFLVNDESAYIADFDSIGYSLVTDDLVFLMANFWTREQRTQYEKPLLRRYHAALNQPDYTWDMLINDYRLMLLFRLFHPVWDATVGSSETYWRNKMSCLIAAYQDWEVEKRI